MSHQSDATLFKFQLHTRQYIFGGRGDLNRHQRTVHENEMSHKCKICPKSFGGKGHLKRHQSTIHENEKPFLVTENLFHRI